MGAEQAVAAEKQGEKIAVGQYVVYLGYLEVVAPEQKLFLAISQRAYETIFSKPAFQLIVRRFNISLVVINIEKEEVVLWTN